MVAERSIPTDTAREGVADDLWDPPAPADPDLVDDLAASEAAAVFWESLGDDDREGQDTFSADGYPPSRATGSVDWG